VDFHLYETLATGELHYDGNESGETFPADVLAAIDDVTTDGLAAFADTFADLDDDTIMDRAWK
jgi:hypothetical protein